MLLKDDYTMSRTEGKPRRRGGVSFVELARGYQSVAIIAIVLGAILEPVTQIDIRFALFDTEVHIGKAASRLTTPPPHHRRTQDPASEAGFFDAVKTC